MEGKGAGLERVVDMVEQCQGAHQGYCDTGGGGDMVRRQDTTMVPPTSL